MSNQPMTDRRLAQTSGSQRRNGVRLLLGGAVMIVLGLLVVLVAHGFGNFVGIALAVLGAPPAMAGVALVLSGAVGGRAAQRKDFA